MAGLDAVLVPTLAGVRDAERYRIRRTVESRTPGTAHVRVDGREVVAFCSNDYLGLADHPRVTEALVEGARRWGVGSGAAHLVSGHCREHRLLEDALAEFTTRPRALLFSTGYMANLGVIRSLVGRGDRVFEDRLNHASLLDAGLASGARFARYPHGDVAVLEKWLGANFPGTDGPGSDAPRLGPPDSGGAAHDRKKWLRANFRTVVATDGVFSMDGDIAPLAGLAAACRAHDAWLMIDDAHGFGVLGPQGRGSLEVAGLGESDAPILMCTLGKALGVFGAFVAGSEPLIETLIQRGRTYIYTTALPPAVAAAARAALLVQAEESWRRERVLAHATRFRVAASDLGLALLPSKTPIQPVLMGSEASALAASAALLDRGLWVPAIRPPTVPAGRSRLRVTFSAAHTEQDVDRLLAALAEVSAQGSAA
jgi:8-amino-7-oxononanoate synthase